MHGGLREADLDPPDRIDAAMPAARARFLR